MRPMFYTIDESNKPVPIWNVLEWAQALGELHRTSRAHVGFETVNGWILSTVFIGIATGDDPPLLWVTMLYKETDPETRNFWRYASYDEAKRDHEELVKRISTVAS